MIHWHSLIGITRGHVCHHHLGIIWLHMRVLVVHIDGKIVHLISWIGIVTLRIILNVFCLLLLFLSSLAQFLLPRNLEFFQDVFRYTFIDKLLSHILNNFIDYTLVKFFRTFSHYFYCVYYCIIMKLNYIIKGLNSIIQTSLIFKRSFLRLKVILFLKLVYVLPVCYILDTLNDIKSFILD